MNIIGIMNPKFWLATKFDTMKVKIVQAITTIISKSSNSLDFLITLKT